MDQNHLEQTKRIARNTLFLYGRMFLGMLISLYTSRLILEGLGIIDYGIYGVVGGLVGMLSLVSSALSSSISRFITFELGTGNKENLKKVFATSIIIQIAMSVAVLIVGETLGLWFVNTQLTIPADKIYAANWVYQASMLAFVLGLLQCPYSALLVAYEKMNVFAYFGILDLVFRLFIALFLVYAPFQYDHLIIYSLACVAWGMMMQGIYFRYCTKNFEVTHTKLKFDKSYWKKMLGFSTWNGIGCTAGILKDQGVNILLNIFFGPVVNAARSIGYQVTGAITSFAGNFMTALVPQITKSYSAGDIPYTFSLVYRGSRFSYYIMIILAVPILLYTPYILKIWLGVFPDYSIQFVRLVIILALVDILSNTLITLQNANGNIRNYQLAVGTTLFLNFPLSWLALKSGCNPLSVYYVAICVGVACLFLRLAFLRKTVGLPMLDYLKSVVGNVMVVTIMTFIFPTMIWYIMGSTSFLSLICASLVSLLWGGTVVLFIGCTTNERIFIMSRLPILKRFAR